MNNTIKIGIIGLLIIISISVVLIVDAKAPNDYFAAMSVWNNIESISDTEQNVTFPLILIPVTGSPSYQLSAVQMTVTLNISQSLATNNNKIRSKINNISSSKGYNLKKIIWYPFDIINP